MHIVSNISAELLHLDMQVETNMTMIVHVMPRIRKVIVSQCTTAPSWPFRSVTRGLFHQLNCGMWLWVLRQGHKQEWRQSFFKTRSGISVLQFWMQSFSCQNQHAMVDNLPDFFKMGLSKLGLKKFRNHISPSCWSWCFNPPIDVSFCSDEVVGLPVSTECWHNCSRQQASKC